MKCTYVLLYLILFCGMIFTSCKNTSSVIPLDGKWEVALDPEDVGTAGEWQQKNFSDVIILPGSLQEQGFGYNVGLDTKWTGLVVDSGWYYAPEYEKYRQPGNMKVPFWLNPDKHYVGVAWYRKEVDVPSGWENRPVVLQLERAHWGTTLYVDGRKAGDQVALQTPHRYTLTGLTAGKHTLTLRVDNRLLENVGINAHSVSDHTQTNWNGIIGEMTLSAKPSVYIDRVQIYPDIYKKTAHVKVQLKGKAQQQAASLTLQAVNPDGKPIGQLVEIAVSPDSQDALLSADVALGNDALLWSEHTPNVYQMKITVNASDGKDTNVQNFGLREFKAKGTRFEINGQPVFLRGTLECCIFPLTGYPSMEKTYWQKIYRTCKEYGLNHVRFHSWCPPEVAFEVADSMGVYLQVECGVWSSIGDGNTLDNWLKEESGRILDEYGNHPSFCLFTHGNEPGGSNLTKYLTDLVNYWKAKDNRRVYTGSADFSYIETADYQNTATPRIQGWGAGLNSIINSKAPRTDFDFRHLIRTNMPTVSHEIGQWCAYPNFHEIKKYTGVLKAKNFEVFQEMLAEKNMADLADEFLYASGRLQTLCYKADIEAALRTPDFAGFQLLDLHDFPGQGTALVGVLDPFWDSKGYVDGKEYSTFCNATVPLLRFPKMIWTNEEILDVPLEFAHFGEAPVPSANIVWSITSTDNRFLKKGSMVADLPIGNVIQVGNIKCLFQEISQPTQLTVKVKVEGLPVENSWNIWVYPAVKPQVAELPYITDRLDQTTVDKLNGGENVLLLTYGKVKPDKGGDIAVGFSSIFWNTAWTRAQAPHTLGVYCDPKHPALAAFPNEGYSDYQWWNVVSACNAMVLDGFPKDFRPVVHLIDDWFTNRKLGILFETKVGKGKLMVCSADLQNDLDGRPGAAQFRQSILQYMASGEFNPAAEVAPDNIRELLKE